MRGLSKTAIEEVEALALALLAAAVKKHGHNIPVNDPDYCEAFGVLRGAIATQGKRISPKIRVEPGHGEWTHVDVHSWCKMLLNRVLRG